MAGSFPRCPRLLDFTYKANYSVYPTDELLIIGCEFFIGADHPAVRGLPANIYPGTCRAYGAEHLMGDALRGWLWSTSDAPTTQWPAVENFCIGQSPYLALAQTSPPIGSIGRKKNGDGRKNTNAKSGRAGLEEHLYTRRRMDIQRWVADAPFTKAGDVPQDSPDRLGWYMGYPMG